MKAIILLAGYGTRMRPHTWSRPKPLLNVAGNTVLGHILDEMREVLTEEVVFVVGYKGDEIEHWIRSNYPDLDAHFVIQEEALGQAHAVWLCRDYLAEGDVLLAFGDAVVKADFAGLPREDADANFTSIEFDDPRAYGVMVLNEEGFVTRFIEKPSTTEHKKVIVGINWFRDARQLRDAVDAVMDQNLQTKGEYYMVDAYEVMLKKGSRITTTEVVFWLDAGQPDHLLRTNRRLLSLGYASEDALERSFAEGFAVIPPVFLHPDCEIDGSVIGPYATIAEGVTVRGSIIRNSVIDAGASIDSVILEDTLVGESARLRGKASSLFVGDDSQVEFS